MSKHPHQVSRANFCRVLLTETLPYETPIIFSNEGLYDRAVANKVTDPIELILLNTLLYGKGVKQKFTVPHTYKVTKRGIELRRLALLHPRSQWAIKEFYEKYSSLLLQHCSRSPASIRAPMKVAGTYFRRNAWENISQYRSTAVEIDDQDEVAKHSPSFFAYRGYDRLYKFFDSPDYLELEKAFRFQMSLDVAKCFDSIYTHAMSWAVKDKDFTKQHVSVRSTFAQEFDSLMQNANHSETNGIVIGPEISRIFAEILFQEIDARTIVKLKDLHLGKDYALRRYVDDVFIFANSQENAERVYATYADELLGLNLHVNAEKRALVDRPFATPKSRLIHAVSQAANSFFEKFLDTSEDNTTLTPRRIKSNWKLTRSFIETIKSLCSSNDVGYDDVSSYLIAVLNERVKKLVAAEEVAEDGEVAYRDAIVVIVEVMFFLYNVAPTVAASYKVGSAVILLSRFVKAKIPVYEDTVAQRMYELVEGCLKETGGHSPEAEGYLPLETVNVVLAARELGANYLLPERVLLGLFGSPTKDCYFTIISCLYYIGTERTRYSRAETMALDAAKKFLRDLSDIAINTEKAYLLLDMLSCPYVDLPLKKRWLGNFFANLGIAQPSAADVASFFANAASTPWQVSWKDIDLLNSLEKKELKQVY